MKAKPINVTLLAAAFLLALALIVLVAIPRWREHQLMRQSEPIQASLESYLLHHSQYPSSLAQIGISERIEGHSSTAVKLIRLTSFGSERVLASP